MSIKFFVRKANYCFVRTQEVLKQDDACVLFLLVFLNNCFGQREIGNMVNLIWSSGRNAFFGGPVMTKLLSCITLLCWVLLLGDYSFRNVIPRCCALFSKHNISRSRLLTLNDIRIVRNLRHAVDTVLRTRLTSIETESKKIYNGMPTSWAYQ